MRGLKELPHSCFSFLLQISGKPFSIKDDQLIQYLSVPNSPLYRKIMRFFYQEYEKMHFQLYKEDVFEFMAVLELTL